MSFFVRIRTCNSKKRNASSYFPVAGAQCWPRRRGTVRVASPLASLILPCVRARKKNPTSSPWHRDIRLRHVYFAPKIIRKEMKPRGLRAFNWFLGPDVCLMPLTGQALCVPPPCQIKGQCLDGEATLLFLAVQPRERPNKSGGNVVTGELERSLPTGGGN